MPPSTFLRSDGAFRHVPEKPWASALGSRHSTSMSTSPSSTKSPSFTLNVLTVPETADCTGICIFIDSSMTTSGSIAISSPGLTRNSRTTPAMLDTTRFILTKKAPFQADISLYIPCTAFRAADNCLDCLHVGDSVFNWSRHAGVVQYCLRKCVTLESILVTDVKQDFLDFISILIPDFARFIRWGVEWDLDFNTTCSTEDVDSLIGH